MAIFIIDQFSLNTDLPLDIRYVPINGRFDQDISIYKYPGMQVYDNTDESIWYCDNLLNWVKVGSGSDASINNIINIINDLSALVYQHEASIGDIYNSLTNIDSSLQDYGVLLQIHDNSIGLLELHVSSIDSSINNINLYQGIQDISIAAISADITQIEASIIRIDSSITNLYNWNTSQDSSITTINQSITTINASIGGINNYQNTQDVSIADLYTQIGGNDASITDLYEWQSAQDASIDNINIYQGIQDISIAAIESSLGDYVKKAGDTMTGPLTITEGGLLVGSIGSPQDVSIYSNLYVHNNAVFGGSVTIDGSLYVRDVETIEVSSGFIILNSGQTGIPPASMQAGIVIDRGISDPYVFIYDESTQAFRIGVAAALTGPSFDDASTQAVATREDNPTNFGVAYWNGTEYLFKTDAGFTFDGNTLLLDSSLTLSGIAGASDLMLVVQSDGNVVAMPIPDISTNSAALIAYIDGSLAMRDASIAANIAAINTINLYQNTQDVSIALNTTKIGIIDGSITYLANIVNTHDVSIGDIYNEITLIDNSINSLYGLVDGVVYGAVNVGDGSAAIYTSTTIDGSLQFRTITGKNSIVVTENGNVIEISIDGSVESTTASNIGTGTDIYAYALNNDLKFKTVSTLDPSTVIITSDNSTFYIDISIAPAIEPSLGGLSDTSINDSALVTHQNIEFDASLQKWVNTNNIWWDNSLPTTTDDIGGITAGTDLSGLTLKEILYKILYEYQVPTLSVTADPIGGTFEKGIAATQFASIDIDWLATNANYPLALLSNIDITKTGAGNIYSNALGNVATSTGTHTDATGINNWGGINRTITYNVAISDNDLGHSQPSITKQANFTFYYKQFWGTVPGNTNINAVDSDMILGLSNNRIAGKVDLNATFDNPSEVFVKYLFAYPDTIASPDNFGLLSQIIDQNDFDLTDTFLTENEDVLIEINNIRYRFYLSKNKVNTSTFDITYKF